MADYIVDSGYLDGVMRGFHTALLSQGDYANLT